MTEDRCRTCDEPLAAGAWGTTPFGRCARCGGVAVEMRHVVPLLEHVTKELREGMDVNHAIAPTDDPRRSEACPRCAGAMESFGYLGTRIAWPQRCGRCLVLWVDDEQMGALCLLYARTRVRRDEAEQRLRDEAEDGSRRTRLMLAGRRAGDLLAGRLVG